MKMVEWTTNEVNWNFIASYSLLCLIVHGEREQWLHFLHHFGRVRSLFSFLSFFLFSNVLSRLERYDKLNNQRYQAIYSNSYILSPIRIVILALECKGCAWTKQKRKINGKFYRRIWRKKKNRKICSQNQRRK